MFKCYLPAMAENSAIDRHYSLSDMLPRAAANAKRSHAGPVASGCNQDAIPALADAFSVRPFTHGSTMTFLSCSTWSTGRCLNRGFIVNMPTYFPSRM